MDYEEMYQVLKGASNREGASHTVIKKWFTKCKIIDGLILTEQLFDHAYERLAPNREDLSMTQFFQFLGVLAREAKGNVNTFTKRFETIKEEVIDEIQKRIRDTGKKYE